jgi:aminopeptidase-like protein
MKREAMMSVDQKDKIEIMGKEMYSLMKRLYPLCRSITGDGVRETLKIIREQIPLEIQEVATGTEVFDWIIPQEWNIRDAYVKNSKGERVIDFKESNLHVLSYSVPVTKKMSTEELREHLFTLPDIPDQIPYLTTYYKKNWGFCVTHNQYEQLEDDLYEVVIDSELKDGALSFGELYLKGQTEEEVLLSCYVCHPSMCNDNLSGTVLLTILAKYLKDMNLKYSYRFLFIPETIGAIAWLNLNEDKIQKIKCGLVATCLGDKGQSTYKKSKMGDALIDRIAEKVLFDSGQPYEIIDFFPMGSDERQFCSPGFNLPVGVLMRTPPDRFSEYHTSADNLDFVDPIHLADSIRKYIDIIFVIENNLTYFSKNPRCEPQLSERDSYHLIGGRGMSPRITAILWILSFSDGRNSLLDIAIRSKISFVEIKEAADALVQMDLLKQADTIKTG